MPAAPRLQQVPVRPFRSTSSEESPMHLLLNRLAAPAALLLTAGLAAAQSPAPPGQPSSPSSSSTAATSGRFPAPLYRMDDVARSMSLTPAQVSRLNAATLDLQTRYT